MSFLAPLFLLGALAVALPVLFHLVRRTTRERTAFSSLMFLRQAPPRLTRRNRLEHLLLLLLRCVVIGLLALGFARPFIKHVLPVTPSADAAKRMIVLLDTSASMQRGKLWPEAREKAESLLRRAGPADQAALFTFDRQLHPLISFEQWQSLPAGNRAAFVRQVLAEAKPGWCSTLLDSAVIRAAEMLTEAEDRGNAGGPRQVVVITDFQAGSRINALQGYDWPKGVELILERVTAPKTSNAGLAWAPQRDEVLHITEPSARLRVSNAPDSRREQFQVGWAGEGGALMSNAVDVYVAPGQTRVVTLPVPAAGSCADRVVLRGDDELFDNTVFVVAPEPAQVSVLYFGSEDETDARQPLYFLRHAFQETRRQSVSVLARQAAAALTPGDLDAAPLLIATRALAGMQGRLVREAVARGKTLLFAPASTNEASMLATLFGEEGLRLEEASASTYGMLSEIDFRHPLFAPFADVRFSDFTRIHFWKHRRLDPDTIPEARVLARFDNGDAALVEAPLGKGRVLVLTAGWQPSDSQLALSSKFVPLLYSLLEMSGAAPPAPAQYVAGEPVALPGEWMRTNASLSVVRPDGTRVGLSASTNNYAEATMPGIYHFTTGLATQRFAVNIDAAESRTAPLALDELERLGVRTPPPAARAAAEVTRKIQLHNTELENRQKLWRWFIVATLAVLLTETWLAGRTARRLAAPGEANV